MLEGAADVGGKLRVSDVGGLPVDEGAESLLARRPEGVGLLRDLGLAEEVVHPAVAAAGVWSRGKLHPLPPTVLGLPTDLTALGRSGLLTARELARLPLDTVLPRTPVDGFTTVGHYVTERLGRPVVDRLVEPLLGGVYAGSADHLSLDAVLPQLAGPVRAERSALAAAQLAAASGGTGATGPAFASLRGGLGRLPGLLVTASGARVRTGATVRSLERTPAGWRLVLGPTTAPEALVVDGVVLAAPAAPAARLLRGIAPHAADDLAGIGYASVAIVTLVYPRSGFHALPAGSGYLVPPVEGRLVKGVTITSQKWGWYAEQSPDLVVVRLSIGRYGEARDLARTDSELAGAAAAELALTAGLTGPPVGVRVTRWGGGLPQYGPGHVARVARIRGAVAQLPGLAVCGAAYDGVGVPACIASGRAAADRVAAAVATPGQWDS